MINNIMEHKTRNGILAFFSGLFFVVVAFYMPDMRGDTSSTIGIYQIVGSVTGYIISGIGGVMVMKETEVRKTIQNILFYGGIIITTISVFADYLGVAGPSGLDKFQVVGLTVGLVIIVSGIFILPQRFFNILHYTLYTGEVASFKLRGTQFILTFTQDANEATCEVYVDHKKIATLNANRTSQWQKTYTSPIFSAGTHQVEFKNIGKTRIIMNAESIQSLDTDVPGVGLYDDTHFNWFYIGSWKQLYLSGTFNGTQHFTHFIGDVATFRFNGTQFILTYTQDTNRADYDVYVDDKKIATINANGILQWQKTYTSPIFPDGTHQVEFKNAGGIGDIMDIDAIEILDTFAPGVGMYDDTNSNWIFSGSWIAYRGKEPYYLKTTHYTSTVGDSACFTFKGTQFKLTYAQAFNRGSIGVYVDGNLVGTINANGTLQYGKTYTSPVFPSETHVVQFKNLGGAGSVIDIDAIQILATTGRALLSAGGSTA